MVMTHDGQCGIHFQSGGYRLLGRLWLAGGDDPKGTVILLHGMPGIEQNVDLALFLREMGWNVLIFHYRGCWGSGGPYRIATLPEDVRSAIDCLTSGQYPQVDPEHFVLVGHSVGAWAALRYTTMDPRVRAVAVIAGVYEMGDLCLSSEVVEKEMVPYLAGYSCEAFFAERAALSTKATVVDALENLAGRPLLIVHGRRDEVIPCADSERLFAAVHQPKQLAIHEEANHVFSWHRDWLRKTVGSWLSGLGSEGDSVPAGKYSGSEAGGNPAAEQNRIL
jgi:hypothetical protein